MTSLEEAAELFRGAGRVLILCHQFPDGDTLGSACALCRGLRQLGKRAAVRCSDPIGPKFAYLFRDLPDDAFEPDLVVTADVADRSLLGEPLLSRWGARVGLSIDHHRASAPFAAHLLTDRSAAAACELVFSLFKQLGIPIGKQTADALYTGITTDTGCFRYANTTPRTHRIAAELMEDGADSVEIDRAMFETKSRARLALERDVLDAARFVSDGRIAVLRVTEAEIRKTGAAEDDLDGIASLSRAIAGVQIGITLREKTDGGIRVSMRARPPADASEICREFGGGGHRGAAGCTLPPPIGTAEKDITAAAERYLNGRL